MRADRNAAGGDEDIRHEPDLEGRARGGGIVRDSWQHVDVRAGGGERGREQHTVRFVDLARTQRLAGSPQLRSGRQDGDTRTSGAHDPSHTRSGKRADLRRVQASAAYHHHVARGHVTRARTDVVIMANSRGNLDVVVIVDNILDGYDSVGSVG